MSHQPERKEKNCLNCGTQVKGRYCQNCGQENIVTHQSFWSLTKHFIYDIFHFDGKFFDTLRYLLLRPGKVPYEYVNGRRTRFLDPIRMYLFTSAVFFLVFFAVSNIDNAVDITGSKYLSKLERYEESTKLYPAIKKGTGDTLMQRKFDLLMDTTQRLRLRALADTKGITDTIPTVQLDNKTFAIAPELNKMEIEGLQDGWVEKKIEGKWKQYKRQYGDDPNQFVTDLIDSFLHRLPYLLFISLPLFALILKLLYLRRKQFFFSDHAIFTLYHYIFSFILMLVFLGLGALQSFTGWGFFSMLDNALLLAWPVYLFIGMKRFYKQGWAKTLGKFVLVNFLGFLSLLLLFVLFIFLSVFQL